MKKDIVTSIEQLRSKCIDVDLNNHKHILEKLAVDLYESVPENGLGLAAPQIGIAERAFIARLDGLYVFINPVIVWNSVEKTPSKESCLSLPGVLKCVDRFACIRVNAYMLQISTDSNQHLIWGEQTRTYKGMDACIVQHEMDHLDGILITDLDETKTAEQKVQERQSKRLERILKSRSKAALVPEKKHIIKIPLESRNRRRRLQKRAKAILEQQSETGGLFN